MLTFSACHFEKTLIPSSKQLTRKPPKAALRRTGNECFFKMAEGKSKQIDPNEEPGEESGRNRDIFRR